MLVLCFLGHGLFEIDGTKEDGDNYQQGKAGKQHGDDSCSCFCQLLIGYVVGLNDAVSDNYSRSFYGIANLDRFFILVEVNRILQVFIWCKIVRFHDKCV